MMLPLLEAAVIKSACNRAQVTTGGALLVDGIESQYTDAAAVSCGKGVIVARLSCIVAADTHRVIAGNCREAGFRSGPLLYSRFQNIAVFASYGDTFFAAADASRLRLRRRMWCMLRMAIRCGWATNLM